MAGHDKMVGSIRYLLHTSCAPKKAAKGNEVLHDLNAPPSQAKIRLYRLQVKTSKRFLLA
jgi:hypothetical protein